MKQFIIGVAVGSAVGTVAGAVLLFDRLIRSEQIRNAMSDAISRKIFEVDMKIGEERFRASYQKYDWFNDVLFDSRDDAWAVEKKLRTLINETGSASVADYHDCIGITGSFIDHKWGWLELNRVSVVDENDSYRLELPVPRYLVNTTIKES